MRQRPGRVIRNHR